MGVDKSAHILTPASTVRRVVNMTALAAVDAQLRGAGRTTGAEAWRSMR
jgi:malate dehydrogenase (oxaloacetate-decarboxylating)(NADP+)